MTDTDRIRAAYDGLQEALGGPLRLPMMKSYRIYLYGVKIGDYDLSVDAECIQDVQDRYPEAYIEEAGAMDWDVVPEEEELGNNGEPLPNWDQEMPEGEI